MGILIAWQIVFTVELKGVEGPGSSRCKPGAADWELVGKRPHVLHHGAAGPGAVIPATGGHASWLLVCVGSSFGWSLQVCV